MRLKVKSSSQVQRLLSGLLFLLLLLDFCKCQDFEIETIEGSASKLEVQTRAVANSTKSRSSKPKFNCIVCDDMRDASCQPWDEFSHSKNCYEDPRIDRNQPIGCRKMVQQVQGRVYVSRQCTNLVADSVQGCIDRVGTKKIKVTYCHCRGRENCNAAAVLRGRGLMTHLLPLLMLCAAALF